jgi:hypothetical protein
MVAFAAGLASFGLAFGTSSWYSSSTFHGGVYVERHVADPNLPALGAAALIVIGVLVLTEWKALVVAAFWGAAALVLVEAIDDGRQWFAPIAYGMAGGAVAVSASDEWWRGWDRVFRWGIAAGIITTGGFAVAVRVGVEGSDWGVGAALFWLAAGLVMAVGMVTAASLASRGRGRWLLLGMSVIMTVFAFLTSFSIGFLFYPVVLVLWIATIRSYRQSDRGNAATSLQGGTTFGSPPA